VTHRLGDNVTSGATACASDRDESLERFGAVSMTLSCTTRAEARRRANDRAITVECASGLRTAITRSTTARIVDAHRIAIDGAIDIRTVSGRGAGSRLWSARTPRPNRNQTRSSETRDILREVHRRRTPRAHAIHVPVISRIVHPLVDRRDLTDPPSALAMLEIENRRRRPVKVIGDEGYLPVEQGQGVA
jgi:hypothetical protein